MNSKSQTRDKDLKKKHIWQRTGTQVYKELQQLHKKTTQFLK